MTNDYVTVPREPTQGMLDAMWKADASLGVAGMYEAALSAAPPAASVRAREIDAFEAGYIQGHDATVEGRYADPSDAAQDYVRTLLVPAVDERAASSEAAVAFDAERFERAPCYLCGYNGRGYYQPETHPCAAKYHAHPAPTTADAGVTDKLVDVVYTAINRLGTPISQATVQAALEAALARAGGK